MSEGLAHELKMVELRLERVCGELASRTKSLGEGLLRAHQALGEEPQERVGQGGERSWRINELGEVQADGARIDNLCGRLGVLEEARAALVRLGGDPK